jgi:hypothetical protein
MVKSIPKPPLGIRCWILLCSACAAAGWLLSAIHQLNAVGYLVVFGMVAAALISLTARGVLPASGGAFRWRRMKSRFRRWLPASFVGLTAMAFVGGALYLPTNYDALAYRTPRVLNWLAEGHWYWIQTEFNRLNTRALGFEWLAAPLIALTRTDRLLFLVNIVSFLLLPGLIFSLFTRLGVRRRVAWYWMWLVPTGYCFLLQAGSIGNDLYGAVFAIAAVDFALRGRESQNTRDVWYSILAAALLTGSKASTLPLLLPWVIAILPSLGLLKHSFARTAVVAALAGVASLGPMILVNLKYSGDWTGIKAEKVEALEQGSLLNVANNTVLLTLQNLAPPIFPWASAWNAAVIRHMPPGLKARLERSFEPGGAHWMLGELQYEEAAGLGFGVTALLLVSVAGGCCGRREKPSGFGFVGRATRKRDASATMGHGEERGGVGSGGCATRKRDASTTMGRDGFGIASRHALLIIGGAYVALLAFMVKSGLTTAARLITPYYALLIPALLLAPGQAEVIRKRWWRMGAAAVFALGALLVVLSPSRPLWPANTVLAMSGTGSRLMERTRAVYEVYRQRADAFAALRDLLPAEARVVGLVASDDPETSLWRPFGHRRIVQVARSDRASDLLGKGIDYVAVNPKKLEMFFGRTFEQWLTEMNGTVLHEVTLPLRVTQGPSKWYIVKLNRTKPA